MRYDRIREIPRLRYNSTAATSTARESVTFSFCLTPQYLTLLPLPIDVSLHRYVPDDFAFSPPYLIPFDFQRATSSSCSSSIAPARRAAITQVPDESSEVAALMTPRLVSDPSLVGLSSSDWSHSFSRNVPALDGRAIPLFSATGPFAAGKIDSDNADCENARIAVVQRQRVIVLTVGGRASQPVPFNNRVNISDTAQQVTRTNTKKAWHQRSAHSQLAAGLVSDRPQ